MRGGYEKYDKENEDNRFGVKKKEKEVEKYFREYVSLKW